MNIPLTDMHASGPAILLLYQCNCTSAYLSKVSSNYQLFFYGRNVLQHKLQLIYRIYSNKTHDPI